MGWLLGDRAVVLGAGMAGLLAARVLADRYAEVTVVDRDELTDGVAPRLGVPQARHAHALLAPGLTAELSGNGALVGMSSMTRACTSAATGSGRRLPASWPSAPVAG